MAVLSELGVDRLSLRGLGNQFNSFDRLFQSKEDAITAVSTNDYIPEPGKLNTVLIAGEPNSIQFWSFDLQDFVNLSEFDAAGNQANKYIELDGVNDYIQFDNAASLLDFTQDWTIGVTLVGVTGHPTPLNMCLFSRGGVHINLKAQEGSSNWGLYVTSNNSLFDANLRAQANTWYAPGDFSRILFTYDATTKYLKYYLGEPSSGVFAQRANLSISQTMIDGQDISGGLEIGNAWSGTGGANFSGTNWNGGVNNLIGAPIAFTGPFLTEYFQDQSTDPDNPNDGFETAEFYSDLDVYCKLGEDTYPDVTDEKGTLTGGELINGTPEDFKDIPTV